MPRMKVEYGEYESVIYRLPSRSVFIGQWKDYLINGVSISPHVTKEMSSVIDLFDNRGRLLHSLKLNERMYLHYLDKNGRLYCWVWDENEFEKVVRYRLELQEE